MGIRQFGVTLLLLLLILAVSGCEGKSAPEGHEGKEASSGPTTLVFKHFKIPGGRGPFEALLKRFEAENPDIRVIDEILPASTDQQHQFYITNLEARSSDFDVFALDVIWVPEFSRAGWLVDVTDLFTERDLEDFLPGPLRAVTYRGKRYAVPWYVDGGVLYYRKDLLEKYGFDPPETMEELFQSAKVILEREEDPSLTGFTWQGKQYEGLVCVALEFITANGGALIEGNKVVVDGPRAIEALRFMRRLVEEGISPPSVTTADEEATRHLFGSGRAIYMRNWPYAWTIFQREGSKVRGKVGVAPIPGFPGGREASTLGGWQLGINRYSKKIEAAKRFVRFLTSPESQREFALSSGFKPSRRSIYFDPALQKAQPFIVGLLSIMEQTVPRPVTPFYPMISQILQAEFSAVVSGIKGPYEAMQSARIQIDHILELEEG